LLALAAASRRDEPAKDERCRARRAHRQRRCRSGPRRGRLLPRDHSRHRAGSSATTSSSRPHHPAPRVGHRAAVGRVAVDRQPGGLPLGGRNVANAFWVAGAMVNGDRSRFVRSLDIRATRIRWTFEHEREEARVQQFAASPRGSGSPRSRSKGTSPSLRLSKNADGVTLDGAAIHNLGGKHRSRRPSRDPRCRRRSNLSAFHDRVRAALRGGSLHGLRARRVLLTLPRSPGAGADLHRCGPEQHRESQQLQGRLRQTSW